MTGGVCSHCRVFKKSGVENSVFRLCRNMGGAAPPLPGQSVAASQRLDGILAWSRERKASNADVYLSRGINDVLFEFMISKIDVNKEMGLLRDRVTVPEEIAALLEKIHPEDEVKHENSIPPALLPKRPWSPDRRTHHGS